ncbi:MAG: YdeI/OmpD-associated family protein [Rhodothermales bacterium]|nr:YdeI/OmpD-associated family protein [Rhodothermales bacterium]
MDVTETLYVATRAAWREWLAAHHASGPEIWLISYRKHTGRPSLPYNDAVEEALCFGWIDSTRKGLDEDRYAQRFTPRKPGSPYSQPNKERLARLVGQGRVLPSVLARLGAGDVAEAYAIPDDIVRALQADAAAWAFFRSTSPSYQRIRAAYVDVARGRPEEFAKRLRHLVEKSARGEPFGYGIESYF